MRKRLRKKLRQKNRLMLWSRCGFKLNRNESIDVAVIMKGCSIPVTCISETWGYYEERYSGYDRRDGEKV